MGESGRAPIAPAAAQSNRLEQAGPRDGLAFVRGCSFSHPESVRAFNRGGNMSSENLSQGDGDVDHLRLSADIVAAYVSRNPVTPDAIPAVIQRVHEAMTALSQPAPPPMEERPKPAVPVSRSVQSDYIVCLEDGKRLKMLKRYLRSRFGMSPEEYRRRWGLAPDYPMVAPAYAERRSDFAKKIGLGRGVRRRA
jgi:predicted transcriptional regulator